MSGIRVTYSGLISLTGGFLTVITGLIFSVILTRTLSIQEYGIWGLINSLTSYVIMIAPIISYWATRETARGIESGKTAVLFSLPISIIGIFIYLLSAFFVADQTHTNKASLFFAVILLPVMFVNSVLTAINLGWKPHVISYSAFLFGIAEILLALIFVYFLHLGISGIIISIFGANVTSIIILMIYAQEKIKKAVKKELLKKWLKLSWLSLYPGIYIVMSTLTVAIFTIITKSIEGVAIWTAANVLASIIANATLISRAVYPKLLESGYGKYVKENLTHLFYFGILITAIVIIFAKAGLFLLNPVYQIAVPVVILLACVGFLTVLTNVFQSLLVGIEKIDINEKATFKDYFKSKLFFVHTIRLIQVSVYFTIFVIGMSLLSHDRPEIDLLIFWAMSALVTQIPLVTYLYLMIRKNFSQIFDSKSILKYLIVSVLIFGITFILMEKLLNFKDDIFEFVPNLSIFLVFAIASYLMITYFVDSKIRRLFENIIQEVKGKRN